MSDIPHVLRTFEEPDPPRKFLHVVTDLPQSPASFAASERHDLRVAISKLEASGEYDGVRWHWSDDPDTQKRPLGPNRD
jgi:hypothetical protein